LPFSYTMMIKMKAALFCFLFAAVSLGQNLPPVNYPKGYFTWPVDARIGLAANFGELRPNHYHMGLDCRTDQRENRPVLAAADGYIARIKIEPFGFGRCIYINHPNGLTTLYAHLNEFYPALESYVTTQQYQQQNWAVSLDVPVGLLSVKKGQFIANSGNTGGSQGPHLHFEIRDTKSDKVLNPLLFGLPVADNIAPDILRLAVYNRNLSTYEQSPRFYPLKKVNGIYTLPAGVLPVNSDAVSFAITAYDRYTGSTSRNGIYQAQLYEDETPVCAFRLDSISYDETRYLNAHIDYKLRNTGGSYVQHLSRMPGYPQMVYKDISGDGVIKLQDGRLHDIKIQVSDAAGNISLLQFSVQRMSTALPAVAVLPLPFSAGDFRPGMINVFENRNISFYLPETALYDSIRFQYRETIPAKGNTIYQLHNGNVPVHGLFPVSIHEPGAMRPDKVVMYRYWQDKSDFKKAFPVTRGGERNWFTASFRSFGNFQLLEDTIPPSIMPIGIREGMNTAKLNRIAFVIKDNTEELENFSAFLDGKWLRFSNDKGATFIYKFDEHCPPGSHELVISVEDCVGNISVRTYHFTR
jgi:hypothetical protein